MMEKGRALGLSLMPVLMWLFVQCAVVLGFPSIMNWLGSVLSVLGADTGGFYSFLEINDTYCIYILMDALVLIPGVLWFRRLPAREEKKQGGFLESLLEVFCCWCWQGWHCSCFPISF